MPTLSIWQQGQAQPTCTRRHWLHWGSLLAATLCQSPGTQAAWSTTAAERKTAAQAAEVGLSPHDLQEHAPDRYTVQAGDTLWGIAARYLRQPWLWPKLWGLNWPLIQNPHQIFPGQSLCLRRSTEQAWLETEPKEATPTLVSSTPPNPAPMRIPLLPTALLKPFLQDILLLSADEVAHAMHIVALPEQRQWVGFGDTAYVWSPEQTAPTGGMWDIFSPPQPVLDAMDGRLLGYESRRIGRAQASPVLLEQAMAWAWPDPVQRIARVSVTEATAEIPVGACLYPWRSASPVSTPPHAIAADWQGQIVALQQRGMSLGGLHQVVMLNRGEAHGLEVGHVLSVLSAVQFQPDTEAVLPRHSKAWLLVFRTFSHLAYALSVHTTDAIRVGDACVAAV